LDGRREEPVKRPYSPWEWPVQAIGIIHSPYRTKEATPIQGRFAPETAGRIEVYPEFADGLKDIEGFSHLVLIYRFHEAGEVKLVRPTFLDDEPHGIFASRHPGRPNALGLTVVELVRRESEVLFVAGIDVLDGTPLLDIKPYLPRFDCFPDASEGWAEGKLLRPKPTGRE
jgi:tRNA (adenine37-N6)-methyltransferase